MCRRQAEIPVEGEVEACTSGGGLARGKLRTTTGGVSLSVRKVSTGAVFEEFAIANGDFSWSRVGADNREVRVNTLYAYE